MPSIEEQDPSGGTTAVRGSASGLNPTVLFDFNSDEYDALSSGHCEIDLIGISASVPEASAIISFGLLLALGLGSLVIAKKKARA